MLTLFDKPIPQQPSTYSRYTLPERNGFDSLTLEKDIKTPTPAKGEVLIAVKAVSLNYRDLITCKGTYPGAAKGVSLLLIDIPGWREFHKSRC